MNDLKLMRADELMHKIYEDNFDHIDFMENMGGGDCDCNIHQTLNLMADYLELKIEEPYCGDCLVPIDQCNHKP